MANIETSPVAPPSIALARMAILLAESRTSGFMIRWNTGDAPLDRRYVLDYPACVYPCSTEYYRILDRISAGKAP